MDFQVDRTDLRRTRVVESPAVTLGAGQVRVALERFAFTANNISYAVTGDRLAYWEFFPAEQPWGRIPVMGYGTVVESAHPDIETGGRYFGFYPMADEVVITARANVNGFVDVAPHRANHAPAYCAFEDVARDSFFRPELADHHLLVRGVFTTSFLVDDALGDSGFHGAEQVLVTSASSKTAIALAHQLARRDGGPRAVGLTSTGNVAFVESLDLYDEVVTYDAVTELDPAVPTGVVDMAGNAELLTTIHRHFGDALRDSTRVGATHWEEMGPLPELPGPPPTFFFAPGQLVKRNADWGVAELQRRVGEALSAFVDHAAGWLHVEHGTGPDAVERVYREMLEGETSPAAGQLLTMR